MKRPVAACILAPALLVLSFACSGNDSRKESVARKPPIAVEVLIAAATATSEGIEVTGSLEPKFSVDVKTQIPGLITQVFVNEWRPVKKGQPLARIDVSEFLAAVKRAEANREAASAFLAQSLVAAARANRERDRILHLKEAGLATRQGVDDAHSEAEAARAKIVASQAQVRVAEEELRQAQAHLAKGLVRSPIDGIVALREVNVGDLASDAAAAKPIFRVVDNRLFNLTVSIPSSESARVKVGQPLEFSVDAVSGAIFSGKVMYINPELNPADRSLKVIAEVKNSAALLKGGLFVKGRIITGRRSGVVQIPRAAFSTWDMTTKNGTVFVVNGDIANLRQVTTGAVANDLVEIRTGLRPGENLVLRGGFTLKQGDRVLVRKINEDSRLPTS